MTIKGLFLDDERNPIDVTWIRYPEEISWVVVRTYQEFIKAIEGSVYDIISFDHDLQDYEDSLRERTGYDCIKFLVEALMEGSLLGEETYHPLVYFHTMNPVGKKNMSNYWLSYTYSSSRGSL